MLHKYVSIGRGFLGAIDYPEEGEQGGSEAGAGAAVAHVCPGVKYGGESSWSGSQDFCG